MELINILIIVFLIGYTLITLEHSISLNKAATALITGSICWVIYSFINTNVKEVNEHLNEHVAEIANILFFLLTAMSIVMTIEVYDGFSIITNAIKIKSKKKLIWILSILTFFLSAILDNLTTTIVMISLLRKIVKEKEERLLFVGIIIIAANAGGAWSPIGDVTTTMLWIRGQISAFNIMEKLIFPSLVCLILPLIMISFKLKGEIKIDDNKKEDKMKDKISNRSKTIVLIAGVTSLIMVPFYKTITHLPPFMGIILGLGLLCIVTLYVNFKEGKEVRKNLNIVNYISKVDTLSIFFFLGILLSVGALQSAGILKDLAGYLDKKIENQNILIMAIGVLSSIIDNVPLVAAAQNMYTFPIDDYFWEFLSYTAGTGGSILVIGSAAGVTAMGMENINFFWYLRNISWMAFIGFLGGSFAFIIQEIMFH